MALVSGTGKGTAKAVLANAGALSRAKTAILTGGGGGSSSFAAAHMVGSTQLIAGMGRFVAGLFGAPQSGGGPMGFAAGVPGYGGGGGGGGGGYDPFAPSVPGGPDHVGAFLQDGGRNLAFPTFESPKEMPKIPVDEKSMPKITIDETPATSTAPTTPTTPTGGNSNITQQMETEAIADLRSNGYDEEGAKYIVEKIKDAAGDDPDKFDDMVGDLPDMDDNWHRAFGEWYARRIGGGNAVDAKAFALEHVGGGAEELKLKFQKKSGKKLIYEIDNEPPILTGLFQGDELAFNTNDGTWYDFVGGDALQIEGASGSPTKDDKRYEIQIKVEMKPDAKAAKKTKEFYDYLVTEFPTYTP